MEPIGEPSNLRIPLGFALLLLLAALFSFLNLFAGTADISWTDVFTARNEGVSTVSRIFWDIRVPRLVAAVLSGVALSLSGLSLQTLFRNPLAGPFVLGISSGASFGVALSLLAGFSFGHFGVLSSAAVGAFAVSVLIMLVARQFENPTILLIVGLLTGYFVDALVSMLIVNSAAESLRVYVSWGMGSFARLTYDCIWIYALAVFVGMGMLALCIRYLNAARLGDEFAKGLGVDVRRDRMLVLLASTILAASSTAFCGPVAFVGIAVPHLAFMLFKTSDHRILFPGAALCGIVLCLASGLFTTIPLNAVLSLVGVPVVIWVVFRSRGSA